MVLHIVLFKPKSDIGEGDRAAMFEALRVASTGIPSVRRFQIGQRIQHEAAYEKMMVEDYPYAASIEFDDLSGLRAYLTHPKHEELGRLFYALLDEALVYDFEAMEPIAAQRAQT
jgi:hypothetical protein